MGEFGRFLDVWKQVQQTLVIAARALDVNLNELELGGRDFTDVIEQVRVQLAALRDAMEHGDLVLVGDILRYELGEPLAHWQDFLSHLYDRAEATAA